MIKKQREGRRKKRILTTLSVQLFETMNELDNHTRSSQFLTLTRSGSPFLPPRKKKRREEKRKKNESNVQSNIWARQTHVLCPAGFSSSLSKAFVIIFIFCSSRPRPALFNGLTNLSDSSWKETHTHTHNLFHTSSPSGQGYQSGEKKNKAKKKNSSLYNTDRSLASRLRTV